MWGESQPAIGGQLFGEVRGDLFVLPPTGDFDELLRRLKTNPDFLRFASETRLREAELRLAATLRKPDLTLSAGVRRLEQSEDNAFVARSEEHTSELQSLMRISYAVFCLKKKNTCKQ